MVRFRLNQIGMPSKSLLRMAVCLFLFVLSVFFAREGWAQFESNVTEELSPMVVTAKGGFAEPWANSPWSTDRLKVNRLLHRARTMPEALAGLPSVMVQKTALGQSSPYLRGLTGYHNVLLVDGIRLNHSAMRSGPNQYWSTVEMLGAERIEVVRGPNGIIHGADAIGGVVNALSAQPSFSSEGMVQGGNFFGRLSSAERSWSAGINGTVSSRDWFAELSHAERSFGDLEGGKEVGKQVNTGYDSRGTNFRLSRRINEDARMTLGIQRSFMNERTSYSQNSGRVDLGRSLTRIGDLAAPRSGTKALLRKVLLGRCRRVGRQGNRHPWHAPTRAGKNSHESRHQRR